MSCITPSRMQWLAGLVISALLFGAPAGAEMTDAEILRFLSAELGMPEGEIIDAVGNLASKAEAALEMQPDILHRLETRMSGSVNAEASVGGPATDSLQAQEDPAHASGPTVDGNDISDGQLIGDILMLEAIVDDYESTLIMIAEYAGGEISVKVREDLDSELQGVTSVLGQLNATASKRFAADELVLVKEQALIAKLEAEIPEKLEEIRANKGDDNLKPLYDHLVRVTVRREQQLKSLRLQAEKPETLSAKVSVDALGSLREREPAVPANELMGVGYKVGKMTTRFDYTTGLAIPKLTGGGVYLVFKDGTATDQLVPPSDLDLKKLRRNGSLPTLKKLGLYEGNLLAPHNRGYTVDIFAEDNTPGVGGPTFRGILLTRKGYFKETNTKMIVGPEMDIVLGGNFGRSLSVDEMSGTYFVDGNTIELQYKNGEITRKVFGTDGKSRLIFGAREYRTRKKK